MPIYEYECLGCGCTTEAFQKFSDPSLCTCPHCQGQLKRLISHTSFQLKGTGWYVTDYSRPDQGGAKSEKAAKAPEPKAETAPKTEAAAKSETVKSETKGSE
jgi:putative FmdB family regulatory protein